MINQIFLQFLLEILLKNKNRLILYKNKILINKKK